MTATPGTLEIVNRTGSPGLISPEYQLLLLCARSEIGPAETAALLKLVAQPLRWDYLLKQASRHGLTPLLSRHLEAFPDAIPDGIRTTLATHFAQNTRRNLALSSTLFSILDALQGAGISSLPYKGPALSDSLYGHLGCRECSDIDVLVRREDALKAKRVLQSAGFAEVFPATDAQNASRVRAGEAFEFIAENGTLVELQWQPLARAWSADIGEDHWNRLRPQMFAGRTVQAFAPEDVFLILALHGAKHAWQRFIWVADIHELVRQTPDLNWHELMARAESAGARRCVLLAIKLAHVLLDTAVPEALARAVASDLRLDSLAGSAIQMATGEEDVISAISAHGYFLRTRERAIDRARFYYRFLTTPGYHEWNLVRLPAPLFPLYSVVRLLRVAGKAIWNPYSSPLSGETE